MGIPGDVASFGGVSSKGAPDLLRGIPAVWLRANCPCPVCRDPLSGQRLTSITDLAAGVRVTDVTASGDAIAIGFEPDGHRATFPLAWLEEARGPAEDDRTEDAKRLWTAQDFPAGLPEGRWRRYADDPVHRAECLASLLTVGFVLLRGVPTAPGAVLTVAGTMGFVRETNYGRLFDVKVTAEPANLAYSALAIPPHTDNPYRDPVPTVQLLHCLESAAAGGDSGLVDGFLAARLLRAADPAAFATLTRTAVTFAYADATAELRATKPMIGIDPRGRIREIRFNNRSLQPLRLAPGPGAPGSAAEVAAFYAAYRGFAEVLARPDLMLTFRLNPGDCLVFDNTRVLHARTGFTAAGRRHLQGCYADLDGVASSLAILRRAAAGQAAGEAEEGDPAR